MNPIPYRIRVQMNQGIPVHFFVRDAKDILEDDVLRCHYVHSDSVHIKHPFGVKDPNKTVQSHVEHDPNCSNPACLGCDENPAHTYQHSLIGDVLLPYQIINGVPTPVDGKGGTFIP